MQRSVSRTSDGCCTHLLDLRRCRLVCGLSRTLLHCTQEWQQGGAHVHYSVLGGDPEVMRWHAYKLKESGGELRIGLALDV